MFDSARRLSVWSDCLKRDVFVLLVAARHLVFCFHGDLDSRGPVFSIVLFWGFRF